MAEKTLSDIIGGGGFSIKSLQRGTSNFSGTNRTRDVTISAVVMAMSIADHSWSSYKSGTNDGASQVELTTTTNLNFSRGGNATDAMSKLSWQVIEYE